MTIPFAVTTVTIKRPPESAQEEDSQDPVVFETVATGVPGNFTYLSGNEARTGGVRERVDRKFIANPDVGITNVDQLVDEQTGDVWQVAWSRVRQGFGLDHIECGVYAVKGFARGLESN